MKNKILLLVSIIITAIGFYGAYHFYPANLILCFIGGAGIAHYGINIYNSKK